MMQQLAYSSSSLSSRNHISDVLGLSRAGLISVEGLLVVATVFLAPMNYLRLDVAYVTAADATALLALLTMLAKRRMALNVFGPATLIWFCSFLAFAGGLLLGSLFRGDPAALPNVLAQYSFSLLALPLVLAGRSFDQTVALIRVLILSLVLVMLFGIYVMNFVDAPNWHLVSPRGRMRSLIERENECAVLGAVAIVMMMGLHRIGVLRLRWVILATPILLYGIMLTGSISGMIILVFGVGLFIFAYGPFYRAIIALAVALLLGAALLLWGEAVLPEIFRERVLEPVLTRNLDNVGNFSDRQLLMHEALAVVKDTMVIGLGVEQFQGISSHGATVHNTYILALAEGGILSLLGVLGFFMAGAFLVWAQLRIKAPDRVWAISLTVLIIYAVSFNMFPTFYARFWNIPLILTLSLSAAHLRQLQTRSQLPPSAQPRLHRRVHR